MPGFFTCNNDAKIHFKCITKCTTFEETIKHMPTKTLTHFEPLGESKELEITVVVDLDDFSVDEVVNVVVINMAFNPSRRINVTDGFALVSELSVGLDKLIQRVDWREVYTETVNQ